MMVPCCHEPLPSVRGLFRTSVPLVAYGFFSCTSVGIFVLACIGFSFLFCPEFCTLVELFVFVAYCQLFACMETSYALTKMIRIMVLMMRLNELRSETCFSFCLPVFAPLLLLC